MDPMGMWIVSIFVNLIYVVSIFKPSGQLQVMKLPATPHWIYSFRLGSPLCSLKILEAKHFAHTAFVAVCVSTRFRKNHVFDFSFQYVSICFNMFQQNMILFFPFIWDFSFVLGCGVAELKTCTEPWEVCSMTRLGTSIGTQLFSALVVLDTLILCVCITSVCMWNGTRLPPLTPPCLNHPEPIEIVSVK